MIGLYHLAISKFNESENYILEQNKFFRTLKMSDMFNGDKINRVCLKYLFLLEI
jgi:hypothetical protein